MYNQCGFAKRGNIMNLILEESIMFETLKNILVEELQLDPEEITPEAELTNDLGINSIELADLVLMCEDKFGVEIGDDDILQFVTVGDVANYLEAHAK